MLITSSLRTRAFSVAVYSGFLIPYSLAGVNVTIDSATLVGHPSGPFSLSLCLSDGSGLGDGNNTLTISSVDFGGGNAQGTATRIGGASGTFASGIVLTDTLFLNCFTQPFAPGKALSFQVSTTTNDDAGQIPDLFTVALLDSAGQPLPTGTGQPSYNPAAALVLSSQSPGIQQYPLLPMLSVSSSHIGSFTQGQPTASYNLSFRNRGAGATSGVVSVSSVLPAGFSVVGLNGSGWACVPATVTCSRSDSLLPGRDYPPITVTGGVSWDASSPLVNHVSINGGGSLVANSTDFTAVLPPFEDLSPNDSFLPAIDLLWESSITTGCQSSPPGYCSSDNITLAQMAVFVVRSVMGNDSFAFSPVPYFTDVPASHLYFKWIQKMQDLGIAVRCGATQYCPDAPVTRGLMGVLIIRGRYGVPMPPNYPATPYFTDVAANHAYFAWIQKMRQLGITSGCTPTTYCPNDPVTRGQMAVFIERGEFNQLLPAGSPVVSWISLASGSPGTSVTVTIAGQNSSFASGLTQVGAGTGIAVSNVLVLNGTTLIAQFSVLPGAAPGPRSVTVTTGTEEAILPNGFVVQ